MNTDIPTPEELDAMSDREYRTLEARLRRAAQRQGLQLQKSRARDPRALTYGTYSLADASTRMQVAGDPHTGYGLSLDEVAAYLWGENMHLHAAANQRWPSSSSTRRPSARPALLPSSAPSTAPMRASIRAAGGPMTGPNP
jgi:hypothetical protein